MQIAYTLLSLEQAYLNGERLQAMIMVIMMR